MTFKVEPRVREISTTTGAGTYTLGGAPTGFQPFSALGANTYTSYYATDGTNWEEAIGRYLSGPDRLERTQVLRSSNSNNPVNWGAGTRTLRCGVSATLDLLRVLSKSVAGTGTVALTQDEQRRHILEFTGALTGNRVVEVDDTPWVWHVLNNTTGAFTLTVKTAAGTGIVVAQGKRALLYCDGTNVVLASNDLAAAGAIALALIDAKGDLILGTANDVAARLAVGANNTVLTADSAQSTGAKWADPNTLISAASETVQGKVELATSAEALAGADATRAVTSAGLASSKSLAVSGYMKLPGGLLIQWGRNAGTTGGSQYSYPIAFPTAPFVHVISGQNGLTDWRVNIDSNSLFTIFVGGGTPSGDWIAVGN